MPVFAYRGLSSNGRAVSGVVDADSPRTARGKLRGMGVFPTDVTRRGGRPLEVVTRAAAHVWPPYPAG